MKTCKKCGESKALDDFYKSPGMRDGHRNECKRCNLDEKRQRYVADPAAAKARVKRWQQQNPERLNAYRRARRLEPEVKRRERAGHLMRKFGITLEQYEAMLDVQGGVCAICGRPPGEISLHVDHNHCNGRIRGLLCFPCNNALADLQEDKEVVERALEYLVVHTPGVAEEIELARARARALRAG